MHTYEGHFWGMHWFWWIIWVAIMAWIFLTPWDIPGQRMKTTSRAEAILKERFAKGEISKEEFEEKRKLIKG